MEAVQKIRCENGAAFVMYFKVTNGKVSSEKSPRFPVGKSQTIDLAGTLKEGDTMWPVVKAIAGKTIASPAKFTFALNGKTAVYKVTGTTLSYKIVQQAGIEAGKQPPGWPAGVPIDNEPYQNWDGTIAVSEIWVCAPRTGQDVVAACNWAVKNGYAVRPRGVMHGWSPLTIPAGLSPDPKILLIDSTIALTSMQFMPASGNLPARVKTGTGASMDALMAFLQAQGGGGKAPGTGYSFPHIPAPGSLSVGGVLAINGHGTAIPNPKDSFPTSYGSMSNHILELTAVVSDPSSPGTYMLKTFQRGDKETTAMLTHLGRTFVVDATLHVIPNYNMRCISTTKINWKDLFKAPSGGSKPDPNTCADFLAQSGRIEVIWFPFTDWPWLKVWSVAPTKPSTSRQVTSPYNYPFSDNLPAWVTALVKKILEIPHFTPTFGQAMLGITNFGLGKDDARDLWGASKDTMIYVRDSTLRVAANGYAVRMKKADVQRAVSEFAVKFEAMLSAYAQQDKYPINSPLEIRVTSLDSGDQVPGANGTYDRPVISALSTDPESVANGWDVACWFDVLTLPGTAYSDEFYAELEDWFVSNYASYARVMPEWSKGWAYSNPGGAWTNPTFMEGIRNNLTVSRASNDNWAWEVATLAKYDASNIFQCPLTQTLFVNP